MPTTLIKTQPVMAVLVSPVTACNLRKQVVNPRIQLLVDANKEVNNVLYFFSLKQVKLKDRIITGYYWNQRYNAWLQKNFPFPDILYIRGGIMKNYTHTFEELFSIVNHNGKIINHPRFNKWQLYQILNRDPVMKRFLPVTREVNHPEDIKKMLQEFEVVYLKAHLGRKGQNVLRVERISDDCYQCSYQKIEKLSIHTGLTFQSLIESIDQFFCGKSFLIQQSIELMKLEDRLIDMRAELQRNGTGKLQIMGISVRLGKPGSPITTHSNAFRFEDFFIDKMNYPKGKMEVLKLTAHNFLFSIYKYIEKFYGEYVEIGIDFAVDVNGKLWLIEANSQSTKVSLEKAYDSFVLSNAYKNILEYARYVITNSRYDTNH